MRTIVADAYKISAPPQKIKIIGGGSTSTDTPDFDAIVVGAGFSGIQMLKSLRDKLGLEVHVYEEAETVGGTWFVSLGVSPTAR